MKYFEVVESLQASGHLDEHIPDLILIKVAFLLLVLHDFLVEVPAVCELHDHAA